MKALLAFLRSIAGSIAGFLLAAVGSVLSLGTLGLVLYWLASPVLSLRFPRLNDWDQSLVWPLIVASGLLWSPSFLLAGIVTRTMKRSGASSALRRLTYLAILWLSAILVWWLLLLVNRDVWA